MGLRIARLFERRTTGAANTRLSAALTRLGPTYVKLGQFLATRPDVVGIGAGARSRIAAGQDGAVPAGAGRGTIEDALGEPLEKLFISFGPAVAAASIAQVHHAEVVSPDGPKPVAVKVLRPGDRAALRRRSRGHRVRGAQRRALLGRGAASAPDRRGRQPAPHLRDGDGSAARSRRALRDGGEHPQRSRLPRAGGRLGPHRAHRAHARMDRRHSALGPRAARSRRPRSQGARRAR